MALSAAAGTAIAAGITAAAGAASAGSQYALTNSANSANWSATNLTNIANLKAALYATNKGQENVRETNALTEALQREQWSRDDTSYQRMVQDMYSAGLNPLSSINSPSSSGLSASFGSASPVAPSFSAPQVKSPDLTSSFNLFATGLSQALREYQDLNLREKQIDLAAISRGINPDDLGDDISHSESLKLIRSQIQASVKELLKNADSPYVKGQGKLKTFVDDLDNVFESIGLPPLTSSISKPFSSAPASHQKYDYRTTASRSVTRSTGLWDKAEQKLDNFYRKLGFGRNPSLYRK